jgi:hypothetical protein
MKRRFSVNRESRRISACKGVWRIQTLNTRETSGQLALKDSALSHKLGMQAEGCCYIRGCCEFPSVLFDREGGHARAGHASFWRGRHGHQASDVDPSQSLYYTSSMTPATLPATITHIQGVSQVKLTRPVHLRLLGGKPS